MYIIVENNLFVVVTRELVIPKSDHKITDNEKNGFSSYYRIKSY